jgi:cytidylate kinase
MSINTERRLNYANITVSGLPGAGSSTLAQSLSEKLGWELFSGGDFMRQEALKRGLFQENGGLHHDATHYDDEFDRSVDFRMRKTLQNKQGNILEAWISGFMAQGVPNTLKVLVICSEPAIRVDRVVNRDTVDIKEAKKHVFEREAKNLEKWRRLYAQEWAEWVVGAGNSRPDKPIYFWYPQLYDLVLDTYSLSPEQTVNSVLRKLGHKD